jgi:hypothetical protein
MADSFNVEAGRPALSPYARHLEGGPAMGPPVQQRPEDGAGIEFMEQPDPTTVGGLQHYFDTTLDRIGQLRGIPEGFPNLAQLGKAGGAESQDADRTREEKALADARQAETEQAEADEAAQQAQQDEEARKAAEKEKLMADLKALETKIMGTMGLYGQALQTGDEERARLLLGQFNDLMQQRQALLDRLGISGLDTDPSTGGYTPIYSGGKGPNGGYFDGYPVTHGQGFQSPTPAPGPIPEGHIVPNGSGQDAVDLGKQYLGQNSIDIKGKLPNFTAAGGQTNNCADFVSSLLESTGRIKGHHVNVSELEQSLRQQGYQEVPKDQAQPGDVWISDSRGHTEMVAERGGTRLIGSNNDRPGHQVISMNSNSSGHYYHLDTR